MFLSLNGVLDFLLKLLLLAPDLLQLSLPLGLQVWILRQESDKLTMVGYKSDPTTNLDRFS